MKKFLLMHHCFLFSREPLPGSWDTDLDQFQKIIVLKCLRADKVTQAMQDYVADNLGQRFIEPQVCLTSHFSGYILAL